MLLGKTHLRSNDSCFRILFSRRHHNLFFDRTATDKLLRFQPTMSLVKLPQHTLLFGLWHTRCCGSPMPTQCVCLGGPTKQTLVGENCQELQAAWQVSRLAKAKFRGPSNPKSPHLWGLARPQSAGFKGWRLGLLWGPARPQTCVWGGHAQLQEGLGWAPKALQSIVVLGPCRATVPKNTSRVSGRHVASVQN